MNYRKTRRNAPLYKDDPVGWALTIEHIVAENFPYDVDPGCRIYCWEDAEFGAEEDEEHAGHWERGEPVVGCSVCEAIDDGTWRERYADTHGYDPGLDPADGAHTAAAYEAGLAGEQAT